MRRGLLSCLLAALACNAQAHRLDEYLQAARVSLTTNRIDVSIDLTPGVAVADQVLDIIDKDRDRQVSTDERDTYAKHVLKDIRLEVDGRVSALNLIDSTFPTLDEVKGGTGTIRIKATAPFGQISAGKHILGITNSHLPAVSVYLVNALVPKDRTIQITRQIRDELQKGYRLDFAVIPSSR